MPALTEEIKERIVHALACFDTPQEVADSVKEAFGLTVSRQQVELYDPTKVSGGALSKKWRAIFEATRKRFLEETGSIAIAHRARRLRILDRMAQRAEQMGSIALTVKILEQAAKESGDAYTNRHRHEHTGKDGGPIETKQPINLDPLTEDQLAAIDDFLARLSPEDLADLRLDIKRDPSGARRLLQPSR